MFDEILNGYLEAAVWTEFAESYSRDFAKKARKDIQDFLDRIPESLLKAALEAVTPSQIGSDFWLTRNGHGTGFWDRPELSKSQGAALTALCQYSPVDTHLRGSKLCLM